jgi:hypothetical protein
MSNFKDHLWRDLVREHGPELARMPKPAGRGHRPRPRLLAGTTAGLAGAGTVVALVLGAASSSPAFAVTQGRDGTVSVVVNRLDAISLVNARLAKLGLRARFVQVVAGCLPPNAVVRSLPRRQALLGSVTVTQGFVKAHFDPRKIPAGQVLVVPAWGEGRAIHATSRPIPVLPGALSGCLSAAAPPGAGASQFRVAPRGAVQCTLAPMPASREALKALSQAQTR